MSRSVTSAVQNAIAVNQVHRQTSRLTVYKSRVFFEANDLVDNSPDFAHPEAEGGHFISEAFSYAEGKFLTVSIDENGALWLLRHDSDVAIQPELATVPVTAGRYSRPGIYGNFVFYKSGATWYRMEIDVDALAADNPDCILSHAAFSNFTEAGSIYPIGENDAFLCYIRDGAVAVGLSIDGGDRIECPSRWIHPTFVYGPTTTADVYLTHFAGGTQTTYGAFFYYSHYDGSIRGVRYHHGMFSDLFVAVPSDLSKSRIGNVFTHNDIVHMCFRFERLEEFTSPAKYTLFSQAKDGFTFNLDMRVLVTTEDYRFLAAFAPDTSDVCFSSTNRHYVTEAPYQLVQEDAPSTTTKLVSVGGTPASATARLVSGKEEYFDDSFVDVSAYCKLEVGVQSSDGNEFVTGGDGKPVPYRFITYHDMVIARVKKDIADGGRDMTLELVPDGLWHTNVMTHPMYMEIQGRQGIYDPARQLDNLYKFSSPAGVKWTLSVDLWNTKGEALNSYTHAALESDDHWSADLKEFLVEYPVFGDESEYEIRVYGWSRGGRPDSNPNVADPTDTETENDDFYALIETEDEGGTIATVVSTVGELTSAHQNPPQTYFEDGARAGSIPVIYTIANPGAGKKIKRLGIRVTSPESTTTYGVERVELLMPAQYKVETVPDEQPFQVVDVTANWPLVDTRTLQVTTGNATNGNEIEMSYTPVSGKLYAIAIVGDVEFTRNGIDYIQDAHFVAQIPSSATPYAAPTWERSYPPGTGPTANAAVKVKFIDWPYYSSTVLTETDIVGESEPRDDHAYLLHWADDRMEDSRVSASYIPYFYSDGTKLKVQFHLAGSGTISDIVRGAFKVYFFESPETIEEFDFFGGDIVPGTAQPFRVMNPSGTWADPYFTPGVDMYEFSGNNVEVVGNEGTNYEAVLVIRNNTAGPAQYRITMRYAGTLDGPEWAPNAPIQQDWGGVAVNNSIPNPGGGVFEYTKVITIPAGTNKNMSQFANVFGSWMVKESRDWFVESVGEPGSNQVPTPTDMFEVTIPVLNITLGETEMGPHIATTKKGEPQIAFSSRPYSAWNFEVVGRFHLKGPYSQGGLIGLGEDENNFMLGYFKDGFAGIAKVRNGVRTDIQEEAVAEAEEGKMMDLRFWHRDGIFGVELKRAQDLWPQRGSQFLYEWDGDEDGTIATNDDIFHVGVYGLIDPPKVRTVGFRGNQDILGILPLDRNPDTGDSGLSEFPSSGKVDIGGRIYNYTGKNTTVTTPRGPFHLRNMGVWPNKFNTDRLGYTYPNTKSVEFLMFDWLPGDPNADDYEGAVVASSEGYAWENDETLFRVWISTSGEVVWLRNRSRWYSDSIPEYFPMDAEKMFVTTGLTGMIAQKSDEFEYHHPFGCFAYIHSDDSVALHGFIGFSGERDYSVMDLLDKFCRIAGTLADAPGDFTQASVELDNGEEVELG